MNEADERDNRRGSYDGLLTKALDPLAFKADAEQGILSGYASKFWVVDSYGEFTMPGAFADSIATRGPDSPNPRIVLRFEHEYTVGTHTKMVEDEKGLYIEAKVSDDGMYGTALRRQLADGVPYGLSIGFRRIRQRPAVAEDPLDLSSAPRWIVEMAAQDPSFLTGLESLKLLEDSAVTFPAVDPAMIDGYRTDDLNERAIKRMWSDLHANRLTPDHITQLKRIASALPADVAPEQTRDVPATTRAADSSGLRNFRAEAALLLVGLGVSERHG